MMRFIPIADGDDFILAADATASWHETAYLICSSHQKVTVAADLEGCLSRVDATELSRLGLGRADAAASVFEDPILAAAIFSWNPISEVEGLAKLFEEKRNEKGLDVGCGFGRLLIPLANLGFNLDGLDESAPLLEYLLSFLPTDNQTSLFRTNMQTFASPCRYGFAYAALNTLRYIETSHGLHHHFRSMAISLQSGGLYAFQISISPDPTKPYRRLWKFDWKGYTHEISWKNVSYCNLSNRIIDEITIVRVSDNVEVHRETQAQRFHSSESIIAIVSQHPAWTLVRCFDSSFRDIQLHDDLEGNFWFLLRRN